MSCVWTESGEGWVTDCGQIFVVTVDTPAENGMKFCCFCGKPLEEERTEELDWEEDDGEKAQG